LGATEGGLSFPLLQARQAAIVEILDIQFRRLGWGLQKPARDRTEGYGDAIGDASVGPLFAVRTFGELPGQNEQNGQNQTGKPDIE
jgi:hypothetical protein